MSQIVSKALALAFATLLVASSLFSGAALAAPSPEALDDGVYWDGQDLEYTVQNSPTWDNSTFEIRTQDDDGNADQLVAQRAANSGTLTIESENLGVGQYVLVAPDGSELVSFEIVEQSLDAGVSADSVKNDGTDTGVDFEFDSNRAQFDLVVAADGLDNDDLMNIFSAHSYRIEDVDPDDNEDEDFVLENVQPGDLAADFDGIAEGAYSFEFSVYDTSAVASADLTVGDANDGVARFSDGQVMTGYAGDLVRIPVSLENTDTATIEVGEADEDGYSVTATVSDDNDDGMVVVYFDTYAAGATDGSIDDALVVHSDSEDSVTVTAEDNLTGYPLDAASYDLTLSVDSRTTDRGAARVLDNPAPQLTGHVAPGATAVDYEDLTEAGTEAGSVAFDDYYMVKVDLYGYDGYFNDSTSAADLKEGSSWASSNGIYFELKQEEADRNRDKVELDLANADLLYDEDNNTAYVVMNPSDFPNAEADDTYELTMNVTHLNPHLADAGAEDADDSVETNAFFTVKDREASIDGLDDDEANEVAAGVVNFTGSTTAAPGTELTVVAESSDDAAPFFMSQRVTVDADRNIAFSFDFSDKAEGAEFEISAADGLSPSYEMVLADSEPEPTPEPPAPETYDLTVNVEDVDGNAVENASVSVGAAATDLQGDAGDTFSVENGTYTVAVNADGFESASTEVTVEGDSEMVTVTLAPVEVSEPEPTPEPTPEPSPEPTDDSTDTTGPGFGIAVAIIALVGAALLAVRRNDGN